MVEWKKLGEVCEVLNGFAFRSQEYVPKGIRIIRISDVQSGFISDKDKVFYPEEKLSQFERYMLNKGDLVMSLTGNPGRVAFIYTESCALNQRVACLRAKSIKNSFLFYLFNCKEFEKIAFANSTGGAQKNLSTTWLNNYLIPIPSLSEQQRIVDILDTFTASIDNLKEQIAQRRKQYEYYRDQLLDLEGKDIEEVLSFGNDFQLKARIGWQGLTKKEYKETGDYKLVTGTDFTRNLRIDFDNCVYVDKERYEQDEYIQLKVGDVLITKDGTLGKVAYIDILEIPATLNGGVFVVRDLKNRVLPKFLMFYLTSYHFKKWMQQNHTTGSIQHLTQKLLSSFTIPVFSLEEQQHIVDILDKFEASIQNLEAQLSQREKQYEYYRNKLLTFE